MDRILLLLFKNYCYLFTFHISKSFIKNHFILQHCIYLLNIKFEQIFANLILLYKYDYNFHLLKFLHSFYSLIFSFF